MSHLDAIEHAERHISAEQAYSDAHDQVKSNVVKALIEDREFVAEFLTEEMWCIKPCIMVKNYPRIISPAELMEHMLKPTSPEQSHELLIAFRDYFLQRNEGAIDKRCEEAAIELLGEAA